MWRGVAITEEPRNEMRAEILENTWDCELPQTSNDAHDSEDRVHSVVEIDYM